MLLVANGARSSTSSRSSGGGISPLWPPLEDCKGEFDTNSEAMAVTTATSTPASSTEAAAKVSSTTETAGESVVGGLVDSESEGMSAKSRTAVSPMSCPDA